MTNLLRKFASKLPIRYQQEMKRFNFNRRMKKGIFQSEEPEFELLNQWVTEGDLVLDIGANVGYYSHRLSSLVGPSGRVLAFEPVPETFELLASNVGKLPYKNVTLFNVAAYHSTGIVGMKIPSFHTGLKNYYRATLETTSNELLVLSLPIDCLSLPKPVKLAKIDVEGHELAVLRGMKNIITKDRPILIVEDNTGDVEDFMKSLNYIFTQYNYSPNRVFHHQENSINL